jgi:hypothetical protein
MKGGAPIMNEEPADREQFTDTFKAETEESVILEMCRRSLSRCGALPLNARLEYEEDRVSEWSGEQIEELWLRSFG